MVVKLFYGEQFFADKYKEENDEEEDNSLSRNIRKSNRERFAEVK